MRRRRFSRHVRLCAGDFIFRRGALDVEVSATLLSSVPPHGRYERLFPFHIAAKDSISLLGPGQKKRSLVLFCAIGARPTYYGGDTCVANYIVGAQGSAWPSESISGVYSYEPLNMQIS